MIGFARAMALLCAFGLSSAVADARAAESCPPTAVVRGPAGPVEEMTRALAERGVRVEPEGLPPGACKTLNVDLEEADGGYRVRIADAWGRLAERNIQGMLTAVALVESWARMDLLESTLPRTPPAQKTGEPETPDRAPIPPVGVSKPAAPPSREHSPVLLHIAAEAGKQQDVAWRGASLTVCGRLGIACLGAEARIAEAEDAGPDTLKSIDLLVALDLPIAIGRLTLTPGIGAGVGWTGSDVHELYCKRGYCRRPLVGRYGPRDFEDRRFVGEAHLSAALRLFGPLSVEIGGVATAGAPDDIDPTVHPIFRARAGLLWGIP